ncbi:unnamed protein product [Oppiella nova]|uniref:Uncharacterized protein n=1 Tax=Oppiella nova TaxID=334625 RepID=A0A7R9MIL8_9ACAR|nr:unnamed protein product [Oppiella nova]CAG2178062.1 unnamed protein product [Oppiella nova]
MPLGPNSRASTRLNISNPAFAGPYTSLLEVRDGHMYELYDSPEVKGIHLHITSEIIKYNN